MTTVTALWTARVTRLRVCIHVHADFFPCRLPCASPQPVYHSKFNDVAGVTELCGCAVLPVRVRPRVCTTNYELFVP